MSIIPEVAPTAGVNNDGVVSGSFNEVALRSFLNSQLAGTMEAYRMDASSTGYNFINVSTAAGNDTAADVFPKYVTVEPTFASAVQ